MAAAASPGALPRRRRPCGAAESGRRGGSARGRTGREVRRFFVYEFLGFFGFFLGFFLCFSRIFKGFLGFSSGDFVGFF